MRIETVARTLPGAGMRAVMPLSHSLRSVSSLLLGTALLMMGGGALSTVLAFRMGAAEQPPWAVGMVMSMYYAGIVLGYGLRPEADCRRRPHPRLRGAGGSMMSAATLAHAFMVDPWLWGALRPAGRHVCRRHVHVHGELGVNERSDNSTRGQIFALYQITVYLAQGVGQFLINSARRVGVCRLSVDVHPDVVGHRAGCGHKGRGAAAAAPGAFPNSCGCGKSRPPA